MQLPVTVETKGIRVLTTKQLAEEYETTPNAIKVNFARNRTRFIDGKHYISLTGDDLKSFKKQVTQSNLVEGRASHLYLWTERGALLHAKSINTDKAWEAYDYLVDFYFRAKENVPAVTAETKQSCSGGKKLLVVDIPENPEAQKLIENVKKHMAALEVLMDGSNKYISKERFESYSKSILNVQMQLIRLITKYAELKYKIIEKVY